MTLLSRLRRLLHPPPPPAHFTRVYTKHTPSTTLSGHLVGEYADGLVLRHATVYYDGQRGGERPLAGDVKVRWSNVDYYTILTPPSE